MSLKRNERGLFLTIWIVLCLGAALWKFWPQAIRRPSALPSAQIEPTLAGIFDSASVDKSGQSEFTVTLRTGSHYRAKLSGQSRKVWLRYRLFGSQKTLYQGEVEARLDPALSDTQIVLPNPLQVRPTQIHIGAQ